MRHCETSIETGSRATTALPAGRHKCRMHGPPPEQRPGICRRQADAAIDNIRASLATISERDLQAAATLLLSCNRVLVTGMLSSFSIAAYVQYIANMALPGWSLIGSTGNSIADPLTELSADDGVLVISYAPYARASLEAAAAAKKIGCRIVAVSDSSLSPVADAADVVLVCGTQAEHYFPSGAAVVTVLEALIGAVVTATGDNGSTQTVAGGTDAPGVRRVLGIEV